MYTYAFFRTSATSIKLPTGIAGQLQIVTAADLSALVEPDLSLEALQQNDEKLLQAVISHDRVICQLFHQTIVLPLRFGTYFVSQESLLTHLDSHCDEYLHKLSNLVGKAEYTLKLMPLGPTGTSVAFDVKRKSLVKKQQYQNQLEQQYQQRMEWQEIMRAIAQAYPNNVQGGTEAGVERLYLLVSYQEKTLLHQRLQHWQRLCPKWELQLGEALPPYHFV